MADPSEYDDTDMTPEEFDEAMARGVEVHVCNMGCRHGRGESSNVTVYKDLSFG